MSLICSFRPATLAAFGVAAFLALSGVPQARAQTVAAMVNGQPITNLDIDQRMKLMALSGQKNSGRAAVLQDLIDENLKIREGKRYGIDPSAADIDASYAQMGERMRLTPEQLNQSLAGRGIRPETLKRRMRADLVWSTLVRGRFQQSLLVGEKSVESAIQLNDKNQTADSYEYLMRPIVLLVPRGGNVEARRSEAEALRSRIKTCAEAINTFRVLRNAAIRPPVSKTSADLPPALRAILDKTPVGQLTPPEVTRQGIEMVALCERKATTADTPEKKAIRDKLYAQKFEAKSKEYLETLRRQALIERR
ncbi:MAG TPA: peptidylprolyl isomerase [Xanthobacteraceae bacterium]|nr:peptidylprolyl isomerase [Xanthobacteraceae bacterium]